MFESTRFVIVLIALPLVASCGSDESGTGADDGASFVPVGTSAGAGGAVDPGTPPGDDSGDVAADAGALDVSGGDGEGGGAGATASVDTPGALPSAPCSGCVELVAPVSGANSATNLQDQALYQFNLPAPGSDFRDGRIIWRLMSLVDDDNLFVTLYAQNGDPDYSSVYPNGQALNATNFPPGTWVDVTLDLSAYGFIPGVAGAGAPGVTLLDPGTFDKTTVESFGIQLRTGSAPMGTRAIRVLVDSVTIEGVPGQASHPFDSGTDGLGVNGYQVPLGTQPPLPH